jgi:CRISPR system Cascade subunit CasD
MSVLVARLAGPLQSWGAEPKLKTATTHPTPTWSGVRGLLRAALGHGRDDPIEAVTWLDDLRCAVRVDRPGQTLVDFHTINPLPQSYEQLDGIGPAERGIVPLGTTLQTKTGQAPRWFAGTVPAVTRRHYLQDAAFLLLLDGSGADLDQLAEALAAPRWALQLGRKSCTPASPVLLGLHPDTIRDIAETAPIMTRGNVPGALDLVWLHGTPDPALPVVRKRTVLDQPLGTHPQHGYAAGQHTVTRVSVANLPTHSGALDVLLTWAATYLAHPARTCQGDPA